MINIFENSVFISIKIYVKIAIFEEKNSLTVAERLKEELVYSSSPALRQVSLFDTKIEIYLNG